VKYIGYGMNTSVYEMRNRCPACVDLGKVTIKNHKFLFSGHADIIECNGSSVQGVLWEITDNCLKSLDNLEGYPFYYDRKSVKVMYNDQEIDAIVYFMQPGRYPSLPSEFYLKTLIDGYIEHNIDVSQIERALIEAEQFQRTHQKDHNEY
jgi:gamma-glutamylcyclotransferase (GGCT)/AIG2-like uncharacterized protein YtfP